MGKLLITESEKKNILSLYNNQIIDESIVFTDWLSPDEKYAIFLDELYDIETKTKLGNIWENFDNFKLFLKHSFDVSNLPKQIKEDFNLSFDKVLITENIQNIIELKNDFKQLMTEGLWSSFKNWAVETGKSSWEGFKEFGKSVYKGTGDFFDKISKGQWKEAFSIIGKGVLYLARKLRSAMYNPIGMILDAILIASQIGIGVQKVVWGIIVALDVYEIITGNYEEQLPIWQRLLFLGVDILGLVFAGAAAKSAKAPLKTALQGLETTEQVAVAVTKNSWLKNLLLKIKSGLDSVPGLLKQASEYLSKKFKPAAKFIDGILNGLGNVIKQMTDFLAKVFGSTSKLAKGTRAGVGTAALVGGIGTYDEYNKEKVTNTKIQLADKIVSNPNLANSINNNLLQQLNNV
jgi:hypothetical protein